MHIITRLAAAAGAVVIAGFATLAAAQDGPLVTADWLADNLDNENVRVFEVSIDTGVYERGHIPGALNLNWHTDLVDTVRRDLVSRENFEVLLQNAGVTEDTTIVLYGDSNNWFAAWGAWIFNYYGHENVKLLDGGRNKWEAEKRALDSRPATVKATNYRVTKTNTALRAYLPDVVAIAKGEKDAALLDIRSPDEYNGKIFAPAGVQELSIRAGHVPGAQNVPWGRVVNADGTFKSADELKALYAGVGIDGSKPVVVYCRIGERSAHSWFVLSQILGYNAIQYDGSWTEYGNAVGVPIENPAGTVWGGV